MHNCEHDGITWCVKPAQRGISYGVTSQGVTSYGITLPAVPLPEDVFRVQAGGLTAAQGPATAGNAGFRV